MPIPTHQPAGDNRTLPLPSRMARMEREADLTMELEMDDDLDADEVWVLSIHVEFADAADDR